jgi:hypothetical protein
MVQPAIAAVRESYSQPGYTVAKQVFSPRALEALKSGLRCVLSKGLSNDTTTETTLDELILKQEAKDHGLVYGASQSVGSSAATYQLLGGSGIFDRIADATGFTANTLHLTPMYLIIQLPGDERFDYVWHQDRTYYSWASDMVTLWFPVNRATKRDTGTISVIPGSHQGGARTADTHFRHGFFRQMEAEIQPGEIEKEVFVELEPGDCCIMHGDTVHRSVMNRSASPRVAGVVRMIDIANLSGYERERFYCVHKS